MRRTFAALSAFLFLLVGVGRPATSQEAPAAQQVAPADEQAVRGVVSRLFEARVKRDVASAAALFAAKAPSRIDARFPANYVFPYDRFEVSGIEVRNLAQQVTSMTARVTADVTLTPTPVDPPRKERWIRNMAFMKEGGVWLVWRDTPAAEDLAVELARVESPDERERLMKAEPELVTEDLARALEVQGDRQAVSGGMPRGLALYELALGIAERVKSPAVIAAMHLKIGQALQMNPATKPWAAAHFEQARDHFTALGDRPRLASAEMGLATTFYMQDDQAAREHYQNAVSVLASLPDRIEEARALHGYGNACYMVGDFAAALEAYNRSMSLQEAAGVRAGVPALWQAIGRVQKDQRDYDAAIESYTKSLADPNDQAAQYGGLLGIADVYRLQGRFELALEQYGRALALTQAQAYDQGSMQVEADIGNVYLSAQQPAAALDHYQKSLALSEKVRNATGSARALAGAGAAYFAQMQYEGALDAYNKALAIQKNKGDIAWLHAHIGMVQSAIEKHEEALQSYQQALGLSLELRDRAAIAVMQTLLATEHSELEHADQALALVKAASTLASDIGNDDTVARAKVVAARVFRKNGDREAARRALQEAMAAVESGRTRAGDDPPDDFFGDNRSAYRAMALLLADEGKAADALLAAERAQIGLLGDILIGNRFLISSGLSDEEREQERRLARQRKSLRVQLAKEQDRSTPDPARVATLTSGLADLEQQRAAFANAVYTAHPVLKRRRGLFDAAPVERLSAAVTDSRTAVLEFVTTDTQTLVLALTRASATAAVQIETKTVDVRLIDLARRVRDYRSLIRTKDVSADKTARELYDLLLGPVQDALGGRTRVIVVPDGPLWGLPFQALQAADGKYLVQRCAVSYAPSLTALDLLSSSSLREAPAASRRRIVAVGNRHPGSAADRLKLLNASASVDAMPNAETEARRMSEVYAGGRARIYAAAAATADAIRTDAQTASALHLATFFVPSASSPMRSPIVLSVRKNGQADIVETWELMRDALPETIVISRVQVDRGGSEGTVPVGVSWAFFVGGAKTVVLATWPDDSPAAVTLMLGLHRGLTRATAASPAWAASALRRAILPLLATKYRHPFYWANYAIVGIG